MSRSCSDSEPARQAGAKSDRRRAEVARADAVARGRTALLAGERVDLRAVAADLGVARATVYRWFGNRDRLLGEVLWSLASDTLAAARARHAGRGPGAERVLAVLGTFLGAMAAHGPFRAFLAAEPSTAARVLMTPAGNVERRVVAAVGELLREEPLDLALDADPIAYAIVRTGEAFLYAEIIAGTEPDVPAAIDVFRLLLRP